MDTQNFQRWLSLLDELTARQKATHVQTMLRFLIVSDAILCSDGVAVYVAFARVQGMTHHVAHAKPGEHCVGASHIQNVNAYHNRLMQWIQCFHCVATNLNNYLGWRRMLEPDLRANILNEPQDASYSKRHTSSFAW